MEILDLICLLSAIITTLFSFWISRLLRSMPLQIITLAGVYAIVVRLLVVLKNFDCIGVKVSTSAQIMTGFWILLLLGMIALWKTVKNMFKQE